MPIHVLNKAKNRGIRHHHKPHGFLKVNSGNRKKNVVDLLSQQFCCYQNNHSYEGGRAYSGGLFEQGGPVTFQSGEFFGRQVVAVGVALAGFGGPVVGGDQLVFAVVNPNLAGICANQQFLDQQPKRCRVVRALKDQVAVAVEFVLAPNHPVVGLLG